MNIVLIGGTVEALLLAYHLQDNHDVYLIELEAELGLPVMHPGCVIEPGLLETYMTEEQQSFLLLSQSKHGWGCRWDWVLKHLAANVARKGVMCLTRTRILSCTQQNTQYVVELSSSERDLPTHLVADRVLLMSQPETQGPGRRHHNLEPHQPEAFPVLTTALWKSGTLLTEDAQHAPTTELQLQRGDGMTELWWKGEMTWTPPRGFFETCSVVLPSDGTQLSFDAVVHRVLAFLKNFV